jgi:predicted CopG family antitoxin
MATKILTITESAYDKLASEKKENESFFKVIERKFKNYNLLNMAGALSKESVKALENAIKVNRKKDQEIHDKKMKEIEKRLKN